MDRADEVSKGRTLHSWKEIAVCLGVTVRSVQRWEQSAGLPVYRQGSGSKARVFAYSDEILAWRARRAEQHADLAPPEAEGAGEVAVPGPLRSRPFGYGLLIVLSTLFAGGIAAWRGGLLPQKRVPADWVVERSVLRVLDAGGRVLFERKFPGITPSFDSETGDKVLIEDIDGDGRKEILLNYIPEDPGKAGGSLACLEPDGKLRWEMRYGALRTFAGRTFSQSYKGRFLRPVTAAGKRRVLTVANQYLWYPAQVALLDPATGRVLEEYWHPGSIHHCFVRDLDRDGKEEVILGAINNPGPGLGHAAIAVLKLPFSSIARHEAAPGDPFPPVMEGRELAYVLFPVPDASAVMGVLPIIGRMAIEQRDRILVQTPTPDGGVAYYLDFNLNVQEFRASDGYGPLHHRFFRQGLLDHELTERETAAMGKVVHLPSAPDGNNPDLARLWEFR